MKKLLISLLLGITALNASAFINASNPSYFDAGNTVAVSQGQTAGSQTSIMHAIAAATAAPGQTVSVPTSLGNLLISSKNGINFTASLNGTEATGIVLSDGTVKLTAPSENGGTITTIIHKDGSTTTTSSL